LTSSSGHVAIVLQINKTGPIIGDRFEMVFDLREKQRKNNKVPQTRNKQ
jgi:hypothetical protein